MGIVPGPIGTVLGMALLQISLYEAEYLPVVLEEPFRDPLDAEGLPVAFPDFFRVTDAVGPDSAEHLEVRAVGLFPLNL